MCCKVLYFILSEDEIYSFNLRLVLNHILNSQDVLSFRNLFFTLLFTKSSIKTLNVQHVRQYVT
jgi:hypothetical protein